MTADLRGLAGYEMIITKKARAFHIQRGALDGSLVMEIMIIIRKRRKGEMDNDEAKDDYAW